MYSAKETTGLGSIKTLTQELLQLGLVTKGLKGELFSRLVMILARDQIGSGPASQDVIQASGKSGKAQARAQGVEVSYSSNKKIPQI